MHALVNLSQATVAVTGATGFLGSYLADALLTRGARVIAVVRNPDKAQALAARGAELRLSRLEDPEALRRAFAGVDAVISNAAMIAFTRPRETMRTNVDGTRNVFEALIGAGVKRAINISSASAYVPSPLRLDERAQLRRGRTDALLAAYGESKAAADRLADQLCARHGVGLTTFRPCGITGPNDPLLRRALERFQRLPLAPFPVLTRIGVVHGADVADAVCSALVRPEVAVGKVYNLQGNTVSLWALGSLLRRLRGTGPWLRIPVPFPYLLRFDDDLARRELAFAPRAVDAIVREWVSTHAPHAL
jgi:nucleoside-diphosphate-sugar epimerase